MTLWTHDVVDAARRIHEAAGFELVQHELQGFFGKALVGRHSTGAL